MIILSDENVKKLVEYRNTQEVLWTKYKERNNLEMMYLVQWSILEKLVKVITIEYRRDILTKSMKSWLAHLDNGQEKPDRTPNFTVDVKVLPNKNELKAALDYYGLNSEIVWSVMDSEGKHRKRRNELAHSGKNFSNTESFQSLHSDLQVTVDIVFSMLKN